MAKWDVSDISSFPCIFGPFSTSMKEVKVEDHSHQGVLIAAAMFQNPSRSEGFPIKKECSNETGCPSTLSTIEIPKPNLEPFNNQKKTNNQQLFFWKRPVHLVTGEKIKRFYFGRATIPIKFGILFRGQYVANVWT